MRGKFISFEGCDGVGKTTQIRRLKEYLLNCGEDVVLIREPGGSEISEQIRAVILDNKNDSMTPDCELLLYFAARAQLVREVILPNLERGVTVICDRFIDSSIAYQGYARGIGIEKVVTLIDLVCAGAMPDATVFIDLDPRNSFKNTSKNPTDRIEKEGLDFQLKVYAGFKKAALLYPERIISIAPEHDKEATTKKIIFALQNFGMIKKNV